MGVTQTDTSKIDAIREEMPLVTNTAYLNTGWFGPMPRVTIEAMKAYEERELTEGRVIPSASERARETRAAARAAMARFFNCSPENIALTRNTTDGINIGVLGINWQPGDEIVTTDMEHSGGYVPVYNIARRYGVTVRLARIGDGSGDTVGAFERVITPRTRMIVTSHLTWTSGAILPLKEIVELAHRHHILVVADAAQSTGSIPIDVVDLGVDVYAGPGQKWLCGPEGTGAVYISDAAMEQIQMTVTGSYSYAGREDVGAYFLPKPTAERYEAGGMFTPAICGKTTSVNWILDTVELEWAYERISELGRYCWDRLSQLDGVQVLTPRDIMAGLVHFTADGIEPKELVGELEQRGIIIRDMTKPVCARVSTGFYNNESDIDALVDAVVDIQKSR